MPPMLIVILADRSDFIVASLVGGRLEEALVQYKRSKENGVDRAEVHIRNVRSILILLGINYKNKPDIVSFPGQCKNTWEENEGCRREIESEMTDHLLDFPHMNGRRCLDAPPMPHHCYIISEWYNTCIGLGALGTCNVLRR